MDRRRFVTGGLAALAAGVCGAAPRRNPNIVLIYADDVGYGDLGCYGAVGVKTPNLDRLAAAGLRFTNLHASSATCTPSRYSLLTGEYAWRRPGTGILPGDAPLILQPGRATLASMLQQARYATAAVGKWHLGLGSGTVDWNGEIRPGPRQIGFDYSFLIPATGDRVPCVFVENQRVVNLDPADPILVSYATPIPGEPTGKEHPELLKLLPSHGHDQAIVNGVSRIGYMSGGKSARWVDENIADTITSKATQFIESRKTDPFFLYFAPHDIHVPRLPNPRFAGSSTMGPRGDAIAELDWSVGEIMSCLERNKLAQDTLLIFSSDNGPVLDDGYRDQAVQKVGDHKPAGPLRGGKYSSFDGGTRVPAIARWPGTIKPHSMSDALISQVDFIASFSKLTAQKPPAAASDSVDVLPALLGRSKTARRSLVEHAGTLALVEGEWKLIEPGNGARINQNTNTELGNLPSPQLYHLAKDPAEKSNLAAQYPDRVKAMTSTLERIKSGGH
jgi:arylsulfatase A-like enzyme